MRLVIELEIWFKSTKIFTLRKSRSLFVLLQFECYKINFDAAILEGTNRVGIGVLCRDCEGHVLVALSQKVALVQSMEMVKALAVKRVVEFAREFEFL